MVRCCDILEYHYDTLSDRDINILCWLFRTPLHEAVRSGSVETVEYLVKYGLDINQRTHGGSGGTPLWWAKILFGLDHDVVKYLQSLGAKDIAPDDYDEDVGDDDDEL